MSELCQRLVDAASDAFDVGTFNFEAVVANVLRELATWCDEDIRQCLVEQTDWEPLGPSDLRAWADSLESYPGHETAGP